MDTVPIPAFTDNYIFAIIDKAKNAMVCVDPGESEPVIAFLKKNDLNLEAILLTHHHFDHIGGVTDLIAKYPSIPVYGPFDERIPQITHPLKEGDFINWHGLTFSILETPGHTSSHISYFCDKIPAVFCGDTLFSAGCGRVFDGTMNQLFHSLQRLKNLPDDTKVFCAHEYTEKNLRFAITVEPNNQAIKSYLNRFETENITCSIPSTIALEKSINPFLNTNKATFEIRRDAKNKV